MPSRGHGGPDTPGRTDRGPWAAVVMGSHYMISSGHYLATVAGLRMLEHRRQRRRRWRRRGPGHQRRADGHDQPWRRGADHDLPGPDQRGDHHLRPGLVAEGGDPRDGQAARERRHRGWHRTDRRASRGRRLADRAESVWHAEPGGGRGAGDRAGRARLSDVPRHAPRPGVDGPPVVRPVADQPSALPAKRPPARARANASCSRPSGAPCSAWSRPSRRRRPTAARPGSPPARDRFYTGDIADEIARFYAREGGLLTREDLAEFAVAVEPPVKTTYRGYEVYACGPWCQGPVVPETLNILEGFDDLGAMGQNSAARCI